ncbi:glutathione S-transferase [Marchantia polymorpha subsp. ruderalis]|uniref:TCHQD class glutathione S-transferase n=2 Tax=Marchantia polymorpha TaxID=3197 RepID=A0A176WKB0_MARPO|nr:hypothetical protein AXG93_1913s1750 [Marchantia polymorpha subsp. ruderalis]PTQ42538.1 hypothetical protein MARPO_0029s0068 [Marchantia polymorpha]BBM96944.1 hypothetical protein Mp_1g01780 [Marchantia polymorpha subsp. ruderalis]|eukprot:PTQ42538.1 hypothetical protein MARPO_0029s0068 [Marchantia polymorpha]
MILCDTIVLWTWVNNFIKESIMQLFHHPLSFNSQKVRIALEEKQVDYWPTRVNPIKARNLDPDFFRQNPDGTIPVLINGQTVMNDTLAILQYIDSINQPLGGERVKRDLVHSWLLKIDAWDSKPFTLSHYPEKVLQFFSRFRRRVVIARMAKFPDLAEKYHAKLNNMHELEARRLDSEAVTANKQQLIDILDAADVELTNSKYLCGQDFSMADVAFIPVLARIEQLPQGASLIEDRKRVSEYWLRMKERPSYKAAIGKYATKLGRVKLIVPAICNVSARRLFGRY